MDVRVKGLTPKGKLAAKLVRAEEKPETLALSRDEVTLLLETLMGFEIHNRLDALADLGLQVSICYGDSAPGAMGPDW